MNCQQLFDKVAAHLLTQNAKSVNKAMSVKTCAYRGDKGRTCAIGCLIPDSMYSSLLEGMSVTAPAVKVRLYGLGIKSKRGLELAERLQYVHDKITVPNWKNALAVLAARYKLNTKVLNKKHKKVSTK